MKKYLTLTAVALACFGVASVSFAKDECSLKLDWTCKSLTPSHKAHDQYSGCFASAGVCETGEVLSCSLDPNQMDSAKYRNECAACVDTNNSVLEVTCSDGDHSRRQIVKRCPAKSNFLNLEVYSIIPEAPEDPAN